MEERRCDRHDAIEKKMDTLIENQSKYMGKQIDLIADVVSIKATINNGIKEKLAITVEQLTETMYSVNKIESTLEDFQWFRDFVNDMRTSVFKHILKWSLIGGVLVFFLSAFFVGGERFWRLFIK